MSYGSCNSRLVVMLHFAIMLTMHVRKCLKLNSVTDYICLYESYSLFILNAKLAKLQISAGKEFLKYQVKQRCILRD